MNAYNALGQVTKLTDRNGSTHGYAHDALGRTLSDSVTVLGAGVDGAVRRLETAYDTAGRAFKFTSHSAAAGSSVVNQVQRAFNGLGQMTAEYQEHAGAVNTATSLKVQYAYDATAASGVLTKGSRGRSMTYPNGRVLRFEYSGGAGLDDAISRMSYLADDNAGAVGTHLEEYGYLGLGTIVQRKHPQPGVDLTYVTAGGTGDGGDPYTGLDRFGRVRDMKWLKVSNGTFTDRFLYTYDRNSNRLSRDVTTTGAPTNRDEAYTYDALDRLAKMNRGALASGTITDANATYTQRWDGAGSSGGLDALGNWKGVSTDADGGGAGSATTQSRTHDGRNQLTGVGGSTLTFDANGNTTTDEIGKQFVYDAWNKLVQAKTSGGTNLVTYKYDALKRRIVTTPQGGTARDDFHSAGWQVLEERESSTVKNQYVWSLAYVDATVLRDRDAAAGGDLGKSGSGLDERLYVQQDANYNVTALLDTSGTVVERYQLLPYGAVTVLNPDWSTDTDGTDFNWFWLHQGLRNDPATGLYHARHREFSSSLGRWVQQDPAGYWDAVNLYEFVNADPVSLLDPSGLAIYVKKGANDPDDFPKKIIEYLEELCSAYEYILVEVKPGVYVVGMASKTIDPDTHAANRQQCDPGCRLVEGFLKKDMIVMYEKGGARFAGNRVYFDPDLVGDPMLFRSDDDYFIDNVIADAASFGHEMIHVLGGDNENSEKETFEAIQIPGGTFSSGKRSHVDEVTTVGSPNAKGAPPSDGRMTENDLRRQLGGPLRVTYQSVDTFPRLRQHIEGAGQ